MLSSAAAEVSTCIAQKLLANERIRIGPEHNGARLTAWRPADHVAGGHVAGHPRGRPRCAARHRRAAACSPCAHRRGKRWKLRDLLRIAPIPPRVISSWSSQVACATPLFPSAPDILSPI